MNALVYHGNAQSRNVVKQFEFYFEKEGQAHTGAYDRQGAYKWEVLVTTYEMVLAESSMLQAVKWQCVIVDEAHRLRNQTSRLSTQLARLNYVHLLLLTGTPIQNNIQELWTLLHFLDAKAFPDLLSFEQAFGNLTEASQVMALQKARLFYVRCITYTC